MAKFAAVVGDPVGHSLSPFLHTAAYRHLGLHQWRYDAVEVPAGQLATFVGGLAPECWAGLSVTMPGKREAAALASWHSPIVEQLGVANTLIPHPSGWAAHNTDVAGIVQTLAPRKPDSAIIFGAGATAASSVLACFELGITHLDVVVREPARSTEVGELATSLGVTCEVLPAAVRLRRSADVVISTIPQPAAAAWWHMHQLQANTILDCSYSPWPSELAQYAQRDGSHVFSGTHMLVHQAVAQIKLMTGHDVPSQVLEAALPPAHSMNDR